MNDSFRQRLFDALEESIAEDGYAKGYPERIIDHAEERQVALDRYQRGRA